MGKINIPQNLPDSQLIKILAEKADQRRDTDFNFFGSLNAFRQRVSDEVRHINQLFPEYTPHDEDYHLKRLFYVADRVLGQERLKTMNSAELFILACALYGHDWGMAVSKTEQLYIITGQLSEGTKSEELWILPNEQERFRTFLRKQGLTEQVRSGVAEIDIVHWREYVRQTHALRSGQRVRRFFESLNGAAAEAIDRVCVGHALDFEELERRELYPANFSALDETVNLRALAVYLRLIDLLDLSEDRTPYVIWKFVAPSSLSEKSDASPTD